MDKFVLEDEALIPAVSGQYLLEQRRQCFHRGNPELPGCLSDGPTDAEARQNVRLIAQEWLDTARLLGRTIPKPVREELYA